MKTRSTLLLTVAVAVTLVLGGAGTAYAAHFQDRALPGTSLGGVSLAGMTRAEVAETVRQRAADATVTLDTGSATRTEHLADVGYSIDVDATVDAAFSANRSWSSYATSLVSSRDVDAVVRTDTVTTDRLVAELVSAEGKEGRNASVALAADKKSFAVTPAAPGQTVDEASLQLVVEAAARDLSSATTTVRFVEVVPRVTTAAAQKVADQANALVSRTVTISAGQDQRAASRKTRASWVTIPSTDGVQGSPSLDAAKLKAWVAAVAKDAKVSPVAGLRNISASGSVLTVVSQARDGAVVSNATDVAEAAVRTFAAGRDYAGTFEFDKVAATWTDRRIAAGAEKLAYPAIDGEKWIDVNLTKHTMTAYVGAKVVYGPIAMVDGAGETPTIVGTFRVYYKNPMMTMRGANADGSDYETPDVPWSTFFHRGYALHGAYWRSTFGYSASHGCVNLPIEVAKWVYDFAPIGTPVVTHR